MSQITKTKITQILNACKFNPRIPGPLKIIADVGNNEYYKSRAIEFITGANGIADDKEDLEYAISLLALAIANEET